ncbi:speckle-type POZ protein-like [Bradysia coprophila]|uniref:speckle-type POZ protein-like n=1 Tax=Bradysia coprophila TaxID=38358 RepID=UPI00187D9DCD|nr:speckle-type POZ protein-like [Bradysia coprophila]
MLPSNPFKRKRSDEYGLETVHTCASTEMEEEIFSFRWTLKNYASFIESSEIRSPIFTGAKNHWQLKVYPKMKAGNTDFLTVYLILVNYGDQSRAPGSIVKARFCISILKADGLPARQIGSEKVCEFKKGSDLGGKLIQSSDIYSLTEVVLIDNAITIHCKIRTDGELKHNVSNGGFAAKRLCLRLEDEAKMQRKKELAADMGRIFDESLMSDLKISTADTCFPGHKAILAARSSVFAAMLGTNMTEKQQNTVEILDFDTDVVRGMLQYLYTGETELIGRHAPDLLRIAEKYDLAGLKEACEHAICDDLNVDNAAMLLNLAHMHNATLLKQCALDFIKRNATKVKQTKGFADLQFAHPKVLLDLYLSQTA